MHRRHHRPHGPAFWPRPLSFDQVAEHRHVECGLYGICLEVVVRRHWPSFTCQPCSLWPRRCQPALAAGPAVVLALPLAGSR
ncbi:MAG: hypothetical protein C4525_13055 [Desulfarculus sp.]|nr:MAG: hypothetical protein C4525_13055 [Desulfarculus sp.]